MSRRRRLRRASLALLVLLLVGVVADRAGALWTQHQAASQLHRQLRTQKAPDVAIPDLPWVAQAWQHRLSTVTVDARDAHVSGVTLARLRVNLRGLLLSPSWQATRVDHLTGDAVVSWAEMERTTTVHVEPADGGRVRATYRAFVLGQKVQVHVVARPILDASRQTMSLAEPVLTVEDIQIPSDLAQETLDAVVAPLRLPLPDSLQARSVIVTPEGLQLAVEGRDVDLSALR